MITLISTVCAILIISRAPTLHCNMLSCLQAKHKLHVLLAFYCLLFSLSGIYTMVYEPLEIFKKKSYNFGKSIPHSCNMHFLHSVLTKQKHINTTHLPYTQNKTSFSHTHFLFKSSFIVRWKTLKSRKGKQAIISFMYKVPGPKPYFYDLFQSIILMYNLFRKHGMTTNQTVWKVFSLMLTYKTQLKNNYLCFYNLLVLTRDINSHSY